MTFFAGSKFAFIRRSLTLSPRLQLYYQTRMGQLQSVCLAPQQYRSALMDVDAEICSCLPPDQTQNVPSTMDNPIRTLTGAPFRVILENLEKSDKKALRLVSRRIKRMVDCEMMTIKFSGIRSHQMDDIMHTLGDWERWTSLESIVFQGSDLTRELVQLFNAATAAGLPMLQHLGFSACRYSAEDFQELVSGEWKSRISSLHFSKNWLLDSAGTDLAVLAQHQMPKLEVLDLPENLFGSESGVYIARLSATCTSLRKLNLERNKIGPDGFLAIAAGHFGHLKELNVSYNRPGIGSDSIEALAKATPILECLKLDGNEHFGPSGGAELAKAATSWCHLRTLSLYRTGLRDEGFEELSSAHFKSLEHLSIGCPCNGVMSLGMGHCGAQALAEFSKNLPFLRSLSLRSSDLKPETLASVFEGNWSVLEELDLGFNQLSSQSLEILAAKCPSSIRRLDLGGTGIGGKDLAILVESTWEHLEVLFTDNGIDFEGATALANAAKDGRLPALRQLYLIVEGDELGFSHQKNHNALKELLSVTWSHLTVLSLDLCGIDIKGATVLSDAASAGRLPVLEQLHIGHIAPKALLRFIKGDKDGERWAPLRRLFIRTNRGMPGNYLAEEIKEIRALYPLLDIIKYGDDRFV